MKNLLPQGMIQKIVFVLFFINYVMFYSQDKTYASSQIDKVDGLCVGCSIQNPQNAVGDNENDFATITIPLSLLGGKVEQTLIFPAITTRHFKKVVIGIGSPSHVLSAKLLGGEAYVESYSGNTSNGDKTLINNNMLELGQNQKKGTIEFTPAKFFDRIKITLNGGALGLNDVLQIYYAYHTPAKFTDCGNPPLDPLAYYSFDENFNDIISNLNLSHSKGPYDLVQGDMACGGSFYSGAQNGSFLSYMNPVVHYDNTRMKTIAFWAKVDDPTGDTNIKPRFAIKTNMIVVSEPKDFLGFTTFTFTAELDSYDDPFGEIPTDVNPIYNTMNWNELVHFTITYDEQKQELCVYKNGIISSCKTNIKTLTSGEHLDIHVEHVKIDELLIYDRALTGNEVKALACSYGKIPNCTSGTSAPASKIAAPMDTFTVSPNPTTGEITLDGNVLLVGSNISIRNTSGTEVYHSPFRSKTFELPATLPGGVYMLTLQTKDKKVYTRKIILTR
ncbi:T9SS type A sorting domain-containing protein [Chryseobacterium capnotolerans]|uniref:T9SS type A sorting domain-containing protein n=1 Tax=Chryseobacterium TaxID=59732 RepID=UPI00083B7DF6|nr:MULTISPECIES: T9SS type A sorting domain-containing protein [Chryseobacterium]UHO37944.1 T9SS type A sorting domain-containing protein [Chryseobacterium capnotolerans]